MPEPILADVDAERGFLAALAWVSSSDPARALAQLEESLVVPERLFLPAHRDVLREIRGLLEAGKAADAAVLAPKLKASKPVQEAGGAAWLSELLDSGGYEHQIPVCADAIRAMALRRTLVTVAKGLEGKARDLGEDPAAALSEASGALSGITLSRRTLRTLAESLIDVVDEMEDAKVGKRRIVPTGFDALDAWIGGWQPTLCVIGAMPGVGKSSILASTVQAMARAGRKVGVFSLEDEARWLAWRILADESGVGQYLLRNKPLMPGEEARVSDSMARIGRYASNVILDDRSALSPREVVLTARDMIINRKCEAIIVDHLGELRFEARHGERYDLELMEGLSDLRDIAKRHCVPAIVAVHLKRRQGLGQGDEPALTDFANSSAIERQARLALGLSREPDSETLKVHILKQTNGRAGKAVELRFKGAAAMVADCENYRPEAHYGEDADR